MRVEAATRRANFWLFLGLVIFAVALCALVLIWMRTRTHAQGGKVYPAVSLFRVHPVFDQAWSEGDAGISFYTVPADMTSESAG